MTLPEDEFFDYLWDRGPLTPAHLVLIHRLVAELRALRARADRLEVELVARELAEFDRMGQLLAERAVEG